MMIKNCLLAVALVSLALAVGCAKGGNGVVTPPPSIDVTTPSSVNSNAIYPTQSVLLTATVSNSTTTAVTWSLSGPGTLTPVSPATTPATATYVAPGCASQTACISSTQPTITATLASDTSITGTLPITVVDITTDVSPFTLSVGTTGGTGGNKGLTQQFTAVAVPDYAPQTFTWTCTAGGSGNSCANFCSGSECDPPIASGLAIYTANDSCSGSCVQISAITPLDQTGCSTNPKNCTIAKASLVTSRVSGTYAFQFSGYDAHGFVAVAGTFTVAVNGSISGAEDQLTSSGTATSISIAGGSYTPTQNDAINSNNEGTLVLPPANGLGPDQYQVVLDGAGDLAMIESDGNGTGSGMAQTSSSKLFTGTTAQTYAFGFTGVDSGGKRVGYAGLMGFNGQLNGNPPTGALSGLIDVNDGGQSSNSVCSGTPPCTVTGTYTQNANGSWHLALTSPVRMSFDFFVGSGTTSAANPLTFYAVSTDPVSTNPAVSGTMVLQDSTKTYNIAAFKGTSVSALTGTVTGATATCTAPPCANVSLTLGATDGDGNFSGVFDQNNGGTILSSVQFPSASQTTSPYTYAASSSANGRYIFQMLGNPSATPVVAPLPFVLYASGANRGFLLDQSSSSVMSGTMNPQGKGSGLFAGSELPATYAAATTGSGSSAVDAIAANLLLTWANTGTCTSECVNGTQYDSANPAGVTLAGTYTIQVAGNGTIAPVSPATTPNYVIYAVDTSGCTSAQNPVCAVQSFLMMDVDKTNPNASIILAQQ